MYVVVVSVVQPRGSHLFRRMQSILFIFFLFSLGRVRNSSISMSMSLAKREGSHQAGKSSARTRASRRHGCVWMLWESLLKKIEIRWIWRRDARRCLFVRMGSSLFFFSLSFSAQE